MIIFEFLKRLTLLEFLKRLFILPFYCVILALWFVAAYIVSIPYYLFTGKELIVDIFD